MNVQNNYQNTCIYQEGEIIMTNKMTTGEIAKKTGISQKAVRLYDEKGLLKPSEYSEGNYRLYDSEALLVLEKIIALKRQYLGNSPKPD